MADLPLRVVVVECTQHSVGGAWGVCAEASRKRGFGPPACLPLHLYGSFADSRGMAGAAGDGEVALNDMWT